MWSNLLDLKLNEENGVPRLKKLGLIATVFIVLVWLLVFIVSPVYANPSWASFNDENRSTPDDDFTGSEDTVYMQGIVTASTDYQVVYYEADIDGAGADETDRLVTENKTSNIIGLLESELYFPNYNLPTTDAGEWHSVVFTDGSTIPNVYDSEASGIVEDDTFTVAVEVIPEFPTVITVIVAMGLSFGIYYWMRQRHHRKVVTA